MQTKNPKQNPSTMDRYSRQVLYPGIGEEGQQKLAASTVLLVGCGALGSSQAETLARAGVGTLLIVDRDVLEASNLQRQCLYDEQQVERRLPKAAAAAERIAQINSTITVDTTALDLNKDNIVPLVERADLVLDGTDNFETRFLLNDACIKTHTPWIYGACVGDYGLTMNIIPKQTPCLRCIFEEMPPPGTLQTCDTAGVIGPIVSIIASLQCTEAIKWLVGAKEKMRKGLLNVELWESSFTPVQITAPRPNCPACQEEALVYLSGQHGQQTTVLCGRNTVQVMPTAQTSVDLKQLAGQLEAHGKLTQNPFLVRLELDELALTVFPDGRALVEGTKDRAEARSLYARYIGT